MEEIRFSNGVALELLAEGDALAGIGEVRAGGTALRSGRRPMGVEIRTPDAQRLRDYRIVERDAGPDGLRLVLAADVEDGGLMDWMVHAVRNRYRTVDWTQGARPSDARLELEIVPVGRTVGGREFTGLRYQYRYASRDLPIYRILDRGTWEPGGRAEGNEFWMRSCFVPPIVRFASPEDFYSSEWYLGEAQNPNIFQFFPLQTELQGFTFTASDAGLLVTWPTEVSHVRSLFEKPRGSSEIVHWHEHCGDLGPALATAPVEVLWSPGGCDRVGRANAYEAAREMVHEALHAQIGMRRERVTTHGMIEEWENPDLDRYTRLGVPKLLEAGAKVIELANHFENNMNVWGVSNMCCTVDYRVAESVGKDRLRRLCDAARAGGARVEMWANTSVSTLTFIFAMRNGRADRIRFLPREGSIMKAFAAAAQPWLRNPSNAVEADHYTPVFAVMNLRDPTVRAYWLKCWKAAHDEVGLEAIFLDSSFNLSSDKFHFDQNAETGKRAGATPDVTELLGKFRPAADPPQAILSEYRAHLDLMVEMQRLGYEYCNEDLGVFGVHRHGPGVEARLESLPLWTECLAGFDVPAIEKAGGDPDDVFFRGLAYRMVW
ncbi:MAG: hypothetical protein IMZ55_15050, partial [Acidobacteria bacterium]|nr:hypothetical protein [Acidobacteriota bacterium]